LIIFQGNREYYNGSAQKLFVEDLTDSDSTFQNRNQSVGYQDHLAYADTSLYEQSTSDINNYEEGKENKPIVKDSRMEKCQSKKTVIGCYSAINTAMNSPSNYN